MVAGRAGCSTQQCREETAELMAAVEGPQGAASRFGPQTRFNWPSAVFENFKFVGNIVKSDFI